MLLTLWPAALLAQVDEAATARAALAQLEAAQVELDAAESARDRVAALTSTVKGYEAGLSALRSGLRRAAIRERALSQKLASEEAEIARLLGALQGMTRTGAPATLLHPAGPMGAARAGLLLSEVTPALNARTARLRTDLQEVQTLRALQSQAEQRLRDGLEGAQTARTRLSQAIADRIDLPRRFTEDPIQIAVLIAATETLESFASALVETQPLETEMTVTGRKGRLALPVQGTLLRRAGEADAAGVARPGIVLATRPRALVTAPFAATLRYVGPLLDYGQVAILEPEKDILLVLAGLDVTFGTAGEVLAEGAPVGLMGGDDPQIGAIVSQDGETPTEGGGASRSETLYIEMRDADRPVNPLDWFITNKE